MPLSFIFCLRNINSKLENEKYKEAGYKSIYKFFSGTSIYNESVVGWLGHMENGSTDDSLESNFLINRKYKLSLFNYSSHIYCRDAF